MMAEEKDMMELLHELLMDANEETEVMTFSEAGLVTQNKGLVVRMPNGDEFQITIKAVD